MSLVPAVCFVLFLSIPSFGFFPEYEHLGDNETREIFTPWLIDTEYQSDKLSYSLPFDWHDQWLRSDNAFQYSAGSLGPTRFMTRGRMKLRKKITERLFLQLSYVDRGDLEDHRNAMIFELGYQVLSKMSLHLYGQPESLKSKDDVGLAAEWSFNKRNRLRMFHTWVDFSHNKRSEDQSRYNEPPRSYGLVWRQTSETGGFQEWSLRHDTKAVREFTDVLRTYGYQGLFVDGKGRMSLGADRGWLQFHGEWGRLFEQDTLNTDRGVSAWDLDRMSFWLQHSHNSWLIPLYGLKFTHYEWSSSGGSVIHTNWMPHLWYPIFAVNDGEVQHKGRLGYEVAWHKGQGPKALRGINDFDERIEHRMNFRYEIAFTKTTRMLFLLSFDMDSLEDSPWEGGNMQFTADF